MRYLHALMLVLALGWSFPVRAVQPDEMLSDPKLETRARAISEQLRCLVCQNNQSTSPKRRLPTICVSWCASGSKLAIAMHR